MNYIVSYVNYKWVLHSAIRASKIEFIFFILMFSNLTKDAGYHKRKFTQKNAVFQCLVVLTSKIFKPGEPNALKKCPKSQKALIRLWFAVSYRAVV